jgi:ABC-type sugar transport system ATPase subunit
MPAPLVRARSLRKEFVGHAVLEDADVEIRRGEILGVIGENGAGKSTFMKILAGIYPPTAGHLELDGRHRHRPCPRRRARSLTRGPELEAPDRRPATDRD